MFPFLTYGQALRLQLMRELRRDGRPASCKIVHSHDLRHTGDTLAARTGASLRDLMARMGHDSPAAALIYQHATTEADRAIADAVIATLSDDEPRDGDDADG